MVLKNQHRCEFLKFFNVKVMCVPFLTDQILYLHPSTERSCMFESGRVFLRLNFGPCLHYTRGNNTIKSTVTRRRGQLPAGSTVRARTNAPAPFVWPFVQPFFRPFLYTSFISVVTGCGDFARTYKLYTYCIVMFLIFQDQFLMLSRPSRVNKKNPAMLNNVRE